MHNRETWEACPQAGLHGGLEGRSTERTDSQVGPGIARRAGMTNTKKCAHPACKCLAPEGSDYRSEEHTSELQSLRHLVCRLLLEKKNNCPKESLRLQLSLDTRADTTWQKH